MCYSVKKTFISEEDFMNKEKLTEIRSWIRSQLEDCADFWLKNGIDN